MPSEWPSKLDLLNVAADQLPVLHGKRQYPLPHRLVARRRLIEERRNLFGTVDQELVCQIWHTLARASLLNLKMYFIVLKSKDRKLTCHFADELA